MADKDKLYNIPLSSDTDSVEERRITAFSTNTEQARNDQPSDLHTHNLEADLSPEEEEEKQRLITQVLELQNTLDDLSSRVDSVKEENLKLKSENQVLGQYIENLMAASTVFHTTTPKSRKK